MSSSSVKVEGLNKTVRALQDLGVEVADLKDVFSEIAAEGARLASSFAPRRTGRLAATIRGNKAKNKAVIAAGKGKIKYAGAINYGWPVRNIRPALFMQRADTALAPKAVQMLETGLDGIIKKAGLDNGN
jgi:hypothetical protein